MIFSVVDGVVHRGSAVVVVDHGAEVDDFAVVVVGGLVVVRRLS